jgi:hypothetical protein
MTDAIICIIPQNFQAYVTDYERGNLRGLTRSRRARSSGSWTDANGARFVRDCRGGYYGTTLLGETRKWKKLHKHAKAASL